jgi:uncharacterized membrane protein
MRVEDVLADGFDLFKKQWSTFIAATAIVALGSLLVIAAAPLVFGLYFMALKTIRGEEVKITDVFKGFNYFVTSWALFIGWMLAVAIGLVFLIVPGLLLLVLFQYAIPIAVSQGVGAIESLKESYVTGRKHLQFSIILGIVLVVVQFVGVALPFGVLITEPFAIIGYSLAALKLKEID